MPTILDEDLLNIIKHFRAPVGKCLAMMAFERRSAVIIGGLIALCHLQLRSTSEGTCPALPEPFETSPPPALASSRRVPTAQDGSDALKAHTGIDAWSG
jgi:hypothetical protein